MRYQTSLVAMALAIAGAPAALASNTATITQSGASHYLGVTQDPGHNGAALIDQSGSQNTTAVYQKDTKTADRDTPDNKVDITQAGNHNFINATSFDGVVLGQRNTQAFGSTNSLILNQAGEFNKIAYGQLGHGNNGTINQGVGAGRGTADHNSASLSQEKYGNFAVIDQAGSSNHVAGKQMQNSSTMLIKQQGSVNELTVSQEFADEAVVDQSGHANTTHVSQFDHFESATIEQSGESNDISLVQLDQNSTAKIVQGGSLNDLKAIQHSQGDFASIAQTGTSGVIQLSQ